MRIRALRNGAAAALLLAPLFVACLSPDNPLPDGLLDGPPPPCGELTYENFGKPFFEAYCIRCHSAANETDAQRSDAPQGINFDTLDSARPFLRRIRLRAGELGDMPPNLLVVPHPSDEQRLQLIQWLDCGTPSANDQAAP